jgi:hypothetical protein
MRVGIAADHAVFAMKKQLAQLLREFGQEVRDLGQSGWIDLRTGDSPAGRSIEAANRGWQQTDKGRTVHKTSCL